MHSPPPPPLPSLLEISHRGFFMETGGSSSVMDTDVDDVEIPPPEENSDDDNLDLISDYEEEEDYADLYDLDDCEVNDDDDDDTPSLLCPSQTFQPPLNVDNMAPGIDPSFYQFAPMNKKVRHNVDEDSKKSDPLKQFDSVDDCSDHHYVKSGTLSTQPHRGWMKAIQDEWRIMQLDLPETIFVRVYETRIDILRAAMVGPQGTPYHDGLFFFDVSFPPTYPTVPPNVYYHSGGLRLNPNLYETGKVCLSLLGTWTGTKYTEKWIPGTSNMLQVLVSIQALILNEKPYFNEPGYEASEGTPNGEKLSLEYSEDTWKKSLKTMLYTMKKPHKHFEELITNHFCNHAHSILEACKAYMDGAQVGSFVRGKPQLQLENYDRGKKSNLKTFKTDVAGLVNLLVKELTRIGAKDCKKFIVPGVPDPVLEDSPTKGKKFAALHSKSKGVSINPK